MKLDINFSVQKCTSSSHLIKFVELHGTLRHFACNFGHELVKVLTPTCLIRPTITAIVVFLATVADIKNPRLSWYSFEKQKRSQPCKKQLLHSG